MKPERAFSRPRCMRIGALVRVLVAGGVCVLAAGCASATNLPAKASSPVGFASARPVNMPNMQSADREALRLLSLA